MIEVRHKRDYFEERICIIPSSREESQRNIDELKNELKKSASEYSLENMISNIK